MVFKPENFGDKLSIKVYANFKDKVGGKKRNLMGTYSVPWLIN